LFAKGLKLVREREMSSVPNFGWDDGKVSVVVVALCVRVIRNGVRKMSDGLIS